MVRSFKFYKSSTKTQILRKRDTINFTLKCKYNQRKLLKLDVQEKNWAPEYLNRAQAKPSFFRYSNMDSCSFGEMCTKTFSVLSFSQTNLLTSIDSKHNINAFIHTSTALKTYTIIGKTGRKINVAWTSISSLWEAVIRDN